MNGMIKRPDIAELRQTGAELGFDLTANDSASFLSLMAGLFDAHDLVDGVAYPLPEVKFDRMLGTRSAPEAVRTEIKGAPEGKLSGKTVTIKCNMKGVFLESLLDKQLQFYGKAQSLNRLLTAAYDDLPTKLDVLLMPTTPMAATPLIGPDTTREKIVECAFGMIQNTRPSCAAGDPSISVPAGTTANGRLIGVVFVRRKLDEKTRYRTAVVVEELSFETKMAA